MNFSSLPHRQDKREALLFLHLTCIRSYIIVSHKVPSKSGQSLLKSKHTELLPYWVTRPPPPHRSRSALWAQTITQLPGLPHGCGQGLDFGALDLGKSSLSSLKGPAQEWHQPGLVPRTENRSRSYERGAENDVLRAPDSFLLAQSCIKAQSADSLFNDLKKK